MLVGFSTTAFLIASMLWTRYNQYSKPSGKIRPLDFSESQ